MSVRIIIGDARNVLATLPSDFFDAIVTSPPYFGLRDYGIEAQIGLEPTLDAYLDAIMQVCRELWRVIKPEGTFWLNIGDSYANDGKWGGSTGGKHATALHDSPVGRNRKVSGLKPKDLMMVPARLALRLQEDGWYLRSAIVWHKPNPMPESVVDRPTSSHEKIFMLSKNQRYYFDADAVREAESVPDWDDGTRVFGGKNKHGANVGHAQTTGRSATARKRGVPPRHEAYANSDQSGLDAVGRGVGRNIRNVWTIATRPYAEAHFATFPPNLVEPCIKAGCPAGGHVLDPFGGAGTTGLVADRLGRNATLIELNPAYAVMARQRIDGDAPLLLGATA